MIKRTWTKEELLYVRRNFRRAESVEDLAKALGRSKSSILRQAGRLKLNRKPPREQSDARLVAAIGDMPSSVGEIAARLGFANRSTNDALRRSQKRGLCHIADYREPNGVGPYVPLWVKGAGENAPKKTAQLAADHEARKHCNKLREPVQPFKAFRDPFTAAFFGAAA